jgi:very-short-patch-repair endonuclease
MPKKRDKSRADVAIARLAANQHGVITSRQLLGAGLQYSGITDRLAAGRLHRVHRRVYAVGHAHLSDRGRWMAGVLAYGRGAVLSHLSAAELWGIHRRHRRPSDTGRSEVPDAHITVPTTAGIRKRRGIILHRSSTLTAVHCTVQEGIPVTTPSRTLTDLHPLLSPAQFAAAEREAEFLRLPLADPLEPDRARTDLEQAMLALCRRHRLPPPEVNVKIDRYEVDFLWRAERLIVEVDGWQGHRTRSAFEEDRARDARLALLGFDVLRLTWRQIAADSSAIASTVRGLLRRAA